MVEFLLIVRWVKLSIYVRFIFYIIFCLIYILYLFIDAVPIPEPSVLPGSDIEFGAFLIGDEAFPLTTYMLRPYSGNNLSADKTYFNEMQAKARNPIEKSFGRLANRFRIFRTEILVNPETVKLITQAATVLHNFIALTADENTPTYPDYMPHRTVFEDIRPTRGRQLREGERRRDTYKDFLYLSRC